MALKKNVGIWVRVSTDFQVADDSPEIHEKRARLYAEAKGWNVVTIYHLDAISGKSVMNYPQTKKMLADVKTGAITGLIFSKLARLARNTKELLEFSEIFRSYDADLISLAESIDTSSPAGRLFYTMIAAMAQWEREEIAERVAASVPIRAKLGKPLGGQASYGYKWDNKTLVIDEQEAVVRKLMYELFVKYKRKGTVAKELNDRGYRTRNGSLFTDTTIGRLLTDPTARGIRRANYTRSLGDKKHWKMKPQSDWIEHPCPAIIPEELWNECQLLLEQQTAVRAKPNKRPVHLFTGIVFCECGMKMYIPSASKKYCCTKCKSIKILKEDLEEIFYHNLKSFLLTDEHLESILEKTDTVIQQKTEELNLLRHDIEKLEDNMDKLINLHLSGELPKEGFNKHYYPLHERSKQLKSSLPEVQAEIDFLKIQYLDSDKVIADAKDLYARWPQLDVESKRSIVEEITNQILVGKDQIKIKFSYTPLLNEIATDSQRNFKDS